MKRHSRDQKPMTAITAKETGPNMFWIKMGSDAFGAEVFGPYDSVDAAAQGIANSSTEAFHLHDGIDRSYKIIAAATEEDAAKVGTEADLFGPDQDTEEES